MWKSNVTRVRSISSRLSTQHASGIEKRWYSSGKLEGDALPITNEEFRSAFEEVVNSQSWKKHTRIGLAISGGVDSMALATLYAKFWNSFLERGSNSDVTPPPELHGFVVNHKVRPESTEEAKWVAEQLRTQLKIPVTVIPLTWPTTTNPASFETEARTLRYQALGQACRDQNISSLMVAHHADDQAETVLMRLMAMRHRSGLQGMRKVYWIPECEGMHGVHQSGGDVYEKISSRDRSRRGGSEKAEEASQSTTNMKYDIPFGIEQGGIEVIRPLLAFSKRRLIATCKQYETPWAEDPTNQDRTLTQRNAIRYMFANNMLPQPLSSSSLVQVANRMQARVNARKAFAEDLFNRIPLKLDIQTSSLVVRLPSSGQLLERPIISSDDRAEAADNGHCLLFRIADLVTPKSRPSLSAVAGLVSQLWPELEASEDTVSPKTNCPKSFTAYGVWWQPWDGTNLFGKSTYERDWLLSRPPLTPREEQLSDVNIVFPPYSESKEQTIGPKWHLFDNRYWIHVHNKTDQEIVLRCMTITEQEALSLNSINKASRAGVFRKSQYYHIYGVISSIKPASLRRSLPVLFTRSPDGIEMPFLLPTLNLDISDQRMKSSRDICDWSIRYKKIDLGQREVSGVVMPVKKQNKFLGSAARFEAKKHASWKSGSNTKRTGKGPRQRTTNAPYPQSRHTVRLLEKELLEGTTNATHSNRVNVAERGALKIGDTSTIESESSTNQHKEGASPVNGGKTRPQTQEQDS